MERPNKAACWSASLTLSVALCAGCTPVPTRCPEPPPYLVRPVDPKELAELDSILRPPSSTASGDSSSSTP